jgi:hypothetical protein
MQPYQEASEEISRQANAPLNIAKNVGGLASAGATAYFGGAAINRVLPFLSKYIPEELAIKGLNKIDPRFGKFINKAMAAGQTFDEVKDLIGSKIEEGAEQSMPAKESRNIIEMYSPELHQFIQEQIQSGRSPLEAGALATLDKKGGKGFKGIIDKIVKDNKAPWAAILQTIYGQGQMAQQQSQQQPQQAPPTQGQPQQVQQGNAKWDQIANSLQNLLKS